MSIKHRWNYEESQTWWNGLSDIERQNLVEEHFASTLSSDEIRKNISDTDILNIYEYEHDTP